MTPVVFVLSFVHSRLGHGRFRLLLPLIVACAACSGTTPTTPTPLIDAIHNTVPAPAFPAVVKPARVFLFAHELTYPVRPYTTASRFVLYDDGTFALQYPQGLEYRGRYRAAGESITFEWEGWSAAGPWGAMATLRADTLTVQYNLIMELTDFENGVYHAVMQ